MPLPASSVALALALALLPQDPPSLQQRIQSLYPRLSASTVVVVQGESHLGSGVIVDSKGLVLTHGHHGRRPQAPVTVVLEGRRRVAGVFLGVDEYFDQSLIRLDGDGPWPAVPLGAPSHLQPGDPCILLGYPKVYWRAGRPPLLRVGQLIGLSPTHFFTSAAALGGDSGGPVFDLDGNLLGTHQLQPFATRGSGEVHVDVFRMLRESLLAGRYRARGDVADAGLPPPALARVMRAVAPSVVAVFVGDQQVAAGVAVDASTIVTKASELYEPLSCRRADGVALAVAIAGADREHDLALLHVEAGGLEAAAWADAPPALGQTVATVRAGGAMHVSTIGSGVIDLPAEYGELAVDVTPAGAGIAGVAVQGIWPGKPETARALKVGDVITHVGGAPTPDAQAFFAARQFDGRPEGVVGNRIDLTIVRAGQTLRVAAPVESRANIQLDDYLGRRTGFPAVFVHDRAVARRQLGGPVFDADGRIAGIDIAIEPDSLTYAVPAQVARQVVERLRRRRRSSLPGRPGCRRRTRAEQPRISRGPRPGPRQDSGTRGT